MEEDLDSIMTIACRKAGLNYDLKPKQAECIKKVVENKDVFAVLPTGYGKTTIYALLPHVWDCLGESNTLMLVISPLVSLMKDQVANISKLNVKSVYIGEASSEDKKELEAGHVQLVLMSPESLFGEKWRDLLSTTLYNMKLKVVVVDEAHCVLSWGEEFRTEYSRLGELRSLLPEASFLALTATSTPSDRHKICSLLCMKNVHEVIGSCDRENLFHGCVKASGEIQICFSWLVSDLREFRDDCTKVIIYCRNIKSCGLIYKFLREELGDQSYFGLPSAKNCLFAMYHHSTPIKNKNIVMENYPKADSTTRVVIATSAFGMGVNVPDVRIVVHWGAPHSLNSYQQQSGRAGRDGHQAISVIYYHPHDISVVATDEPMRLYCKSATCRREFLVNHFTPEYASERQYDLHNCCDVCKLACECGNCPADHRAFQNESNK